MSPDLRNITQREAATEKLSDIPFCKLNKLYQGSVRLDITNLQESAILALLKLNNSKEIIKDKIEQKEMTKINETNDVEIVNCDLKEERVSASEKTESGNALAHKTENSFDHGSEDDESVEGKPNHSYISLIANAILSSPEKRLVLSDIYNYVLQNFPYFRDKGPGWRNSIRHNLSLNECFIKAGRSPNGKGHYWAINPANYDDFSKGDFRRRRAQRRARRAMTFNDLPDHFYPFWYHPYLASTMRRHYSAPLFSTSPHSPSLYPFGPPPHYQNEKRRVSLPSVNALERRRESLSADQPLRLDERQKKKKRSFDVESLLKDDDKEKTPVRKTMSPVNESHPRSNSIPCEHTECCLTKRNLYPITCDIPRHPSIPVPSPGFLSFEHYRSLYHSAIATTEKSHPAPSERFRFYYVQ